MFDPAFAAELKRDGGAADVDMTAAQRGQPIGAVVLGVLSVADADQGGIQQRDDRGHHFVPAETRCCEAGF